MKKDTKEGPDKGWSWVIAFASFLLTFVLFGIYRTSGILLVAFVNEYHVTREDSSWPLFLCFSVVDLTGLIVGPLGLKFGVRPITIFGALLSTLGVSLCYFANGLTFITLSFGIIFGIGFGFTYTLMPVIVNEYFFKLRATANGIANSGGCFGSVLFPLLYEHLMSTYGLNGCLLLTGGVVLQLAISGALMKPPSWLQGDSCIEKSATDEEISLTCGKEAVATTIKDDYGFKIHENLKEEEMKHDSESIFCKNLHDSLEQQTLMNEEPTKAYFIQDKSLGEKIAKDLKPYEELPKSNGKHKDDKTSLDLIDNVKRLSTTSTNLINQNCGSKEISRASFDSDRNSKFELITESIKIKNHNSKNFILGPSSSESLERRQSDASANIHFTNETGQYLFIYDSRENLKNGNLFESRICETNFTQNDKMTGIPIRGIEKSASAGEGEPFLNENVRKGNISVRESFINVLKCPMFYVIALSNVVFFSNEEMYFVINADYFSDKGVAESDIKYLIIAFSASDLLGRLCFGWITDRGYLRRSHFMTLCMLTVSVIFFIFPFVNDFISVMSLNCAYGVLLGCTSTIFTVLPVDYLHMDVQPVAFGCIAFLCGLLTLMCSILVGYFRDNLGSYTNIFYLMGGISILTALTWLLEKHFVKAKISPENKE